MDEISKRWSLKSQKQKIPIRRGSIKREEPGRFLWEEQYSEDLGSDGLGLNPVSVI